MRNLLIRIILPLLLIGVYSEAAKAAPALFIRTGVYQPLQKPGLGLKAFSWQTGLERRFSVHHRLHFSLEYSLSFIRFHQEKLQQTLSEMARRPEVQPGVGLQALWKLSPRTALSGGLQVQTDLSAWGKLRQPPVVEKPQQGPALFQPQFQIGMETSFLLFRRNWRCCVQYQIGFLPGRIQGPVQGVCVGLQYPL